MIDTEYRVKAAKMKKFAPIPSDKYQAQITDVNLTNELNPFSGVNEDKLNFEFTILDNKNFDVVNEEGEKEIESTRGRKVWKYVRPILSPGGKNSKASWFYKLLCAIEKKELGDSDLKDVDPNSLVGAQVIVMLEQTEKGYANILSFGPIQKELEPVPNKEDQASEEALEKLFDGKFES